jgi:signal peptidase I
MSFGFLATFIILAISVVFAVLSLRISASRNEVPNSDDMARRLGVLLFLLVLQWCAIFAVLQRVFRLSFFRVLAPLGTLIALILLEFAVALGAVRPFLIEAFVVPSRSMSPTIDPNDRITVAKMIRPRRWDLVAYHEMGSGGAVFCKRLVGLPDDRLRFTGGNLYINDQLADMPAMIRGRCRASVMGSASRYVENQTIHIGPNEYFLLGDNVEISADSRLYGPAAGNTMVGVVDMIYWPLSKAKILR